MGSVATSEYAEGVAVLGTHAYVGVQSGLQVVDITNPASPRLVGGVDTPAKPGGVAVSGTHVYVANARSGPQILPLQCDVTTPTTKCSNARRLRRTARRSAPERPLLSLPEIDRSKNAAGFVRQVG